MSRPGSGAGATANVGARGANAAQGGPGAGGGGRGGGGSSSTPTSKGEAGPGSGNRSAGAAAASSTDITPLLGASLKLTLANGGTATGKLYAFDPQLGIVALETEPKEAPAYLAASITAGASQSNKPAGETEDSSATRRAGYRLIKIREVNKVEVGSGPGAGAAPNGTAAATGAASGPDVLAALSALNAAASDARANAANRDAHTRASKRGVGVGAQAQAIFDALSKTLPCRWHNTHIIVLDEVVISGPNYDGTSTNVPSFTQDQLRAALDGRPLPPSADGSTLPAQAQSSIRSKAASWQRVIKVLEGERAKMRRESTSASTPAAAAA